MALKHNERVVGGGNGYREILGIDEASDQIWLRAEQDCQDVIDNQKQSQHERLGGMWTGGDGMSYAEVPFVVAMEIKRKHNIDLLGGGEYCGKTLRKVIDTEYPFLRTGSPARMPS